MILNATIIRLLTNVLVCLRRGTLQCCGFWYKISQRWKNERYIGEDVQTRDKEEEETV